MKRSLKCKFGIQLAKNDLGLYHMLTIEIHKVALQFTTFQTGQVLSQWKNKFKVLFLTVHKK